MREVRQVKIEEEPIPTPQPDGLIVKIHYAGVCRSDVSFWEDAYKLSETNVTPLIGKIPGYDFPLVFGHEIAGEVYAIGAKGYAACSDLKVGDRVLVFPWIGCNECGACKAGYSNICKGFGHLKYALGVGRPGGWQSYMSLISTDRIIRLPADIDMRSACMLTCGAVTAYAAIENLKDAVREGVLFNGFARVLIVGAGGVGLWGVQWARLLFPEGTKIYVADVSEDRFPEAKRLGADEGIVWPVTERAEDLAKKVVQVAGDNIDGAVDFFGSSMTSLSLQLTLRKGAHHVNVGMAGGQLNMSLMQASVKARHFHGVYAGTYNQMKELTKLVVEGKVTFPPIEVFKPEDVQEVLEKLKAGKLKRRGVLDFLNN